MRKSEKKTKQNQNDLVDIYSISKAMLLDQFYGFTQYSVFFITKFRQSVCACVCVFSVYLCAVAFFIFLLHSFVH